MKDIYSQALVLTPPITLRTGLNIEVISHVVLDRTENKWS